MIKKLSLILLLAGAQMQAVIDINGKGVNKQALFAGACTQGNHELAKLLIQAGVNVNHETADGMTLLIKAAQRNDIEMVRILLNAGANVNAGLNSNGVVALDCTQNTEIIKLLINAGTSVNNIIANGHNTSLSLKIQSRNIDNIKLLINAGADVNAKLADGHNVLQRGLDHNLDENYLEFLVNLGLDINATLNQSTLLHNSVAQNKIQVVKFLLSLPNINLEAVNPQGKTAFDLAVEGYRLEIIELFQNYFAEQEAKATRSQIDYAVDSNVITIANDTNGQLNVLHQVEVPAHSKAEVTTVISKI